MIWKLHIGFGQCQSCVIILHITIDCRSEYRLVRAIKLPYIQLIQSRYCLLSGYYTTIYNSCYNNKNKNNKWALMKIIIKKINVKVSSSYILRIRISGKFQHRAYCWRLKKSDIQQRKLRTNSHLLFISVLFNNAARTSYYIASNGKMISELWTGKDMEVTRSTGRAIDEAVSRWLHTAAAWVRARVWSSWICGGQSGVGINFLRVLRFPPVSLNSTKFSILRITRGQVQQARNCRRAEWTQFGLHLPLCELTIN
jgi:hypothetical protein